MFSLWNSPLENAGKHLIIALDLEGHHSISKGHHSSICSRFKGIFVHPNDFFLRRFLHKSCSTLSYISKSTWITQFGYVQTKLWPKYNNCSKLKSCDSLKKLQGWRLGTRWRLVTEEYGDDSCTRWRLVTDPSLLPLTPKPSFFILASPKLVASTF